MRVRTADYESAHQIDDGLDLTLTGTILLQSTSAPITTGLGTLSSSVEIDETGAVAGPTPVATSGGGFTITIPILTMQTAANGLGLLFITVTSSISGSRPWTYFIRPWLQAEQDAIETDKFITGQDESLKAPGATVQCSYTGVWAPRELMDLVDGRNVLKSLGYRSKNIGRDPY